MNTIENSTTTKKTLKRLLTQLSNSPNGLFSMGEFDIVTVSRGVLNVFILI